jgi:catalase
MTELLRPLRIYLRHARKMLGIPIELALIGAIVATIATSLAYAAGWIAPGPITPVTIIESLQARDGLRTGFPRAKAGCLGQVCADGEFLEGNR